MASNITEITDAINNLTISNFNITTDNILDVAIASGNNSSDGWLGILVFSIFCMTVFIQILRNKNSFNIVERTTLILISLSVCIDMGIQLLLFGILGSVKIFVWVFVVFFVTGVLSFLKKELNSQDT